ncbi:MAG: hypothetical protein HQL90_14490, partial [Magnetococcales bacterium]|nr:hypothetical protein [Magnetococcales bacterium]
MSGRLIGAVHTNSFTFAGSDGAEYLSADGKWRYRVFLNSGNFVVESGGTRTAEYFSVTPQRSRKQYNTLVVEALIIGGGGSGGRGGGGAGGVRKVVIYLTPGTYPVIVGSGGPSQATAGQNGTKGNDSSFGGFSSAGGGYGAGNPGVAGGDGGSGGGTYSTLSTAGAGNVPYVNPPQGYNGGSANYANMGCGGGGASQAGGIPYNDGSYAVGGKGGDGTSAYP